eukprot:3399014-Amphidinium_carterae.3
MLQCSVTRNQEESNQPSRLYAVSECSKKHPHLQRRTPQPSPGTCSLLDMGWLLAFQNLAQTKRSGVEDAQNDLAKCV